MQFRIIGPHIHQAVSGGSTFTCIRQTTTTDAGLAVRWSACQGERILKADCRTLNEAKNLCRAAAQVAAAGA